MENRIYEPVHPPRKVIGVDDSEFTQETGLLIMVKRDSKYPYILDVGNEGCYQAFKYIREIEVAACAPTTKRR